MLVCQTQLECCLKRIHAAGAGAKTGTSQAIYFAGLGTIVAMYGCQSCPKREINVVGTLDVHGHAHRRRVCNEWMHSIVGGNDGARPDWLLSKVIIKDPLLDALHYVTAEETNHRQIHACIHQAERIAGGDNTIERRQIFKPSANNLNFRMRTKLPSKNIGEFFVPIYKNQSHILASRNTQRPEAEPRHR